MITEIVKSTFTNRYLIGQLAKREIIGRYRGTSLGLAWSLINPLLMLGVYTFVFAIVFPGAMGGNEFGFEDSNLLWSFSLG